MLLNGEGTPAAETPLFDDLGRVTQSLMASAISIKQVDSRGGMGLYKGGNSLFGATFQVRQSRDVTTELRGGIAYVLLGDGDWRASDVDVSITDSTGRTVAADTLVDNEPIVQFRPSTTGKYTLRCQLIQVHPGNDSSFCSMALMEEDGYSVPGGNLGQVLAQIVGASLSAGRSESGIVRIVDHTKAWAVFGGVQSSYPANSMSNFSLNPGQYVLVSVGDVNTLDLDNQIRDGEDRIVGQDTASDRFPITKFVVESSNQNRLTARTMLANSTGASFTLSALLRVDVASTATTSHRP